MARSSARYRLLAVLFSGCTLLGACTPAQVSQFTGNLQQMASPSQDYTWQYKSQTYHFTSMKTSYTDVVTQAGPPLKEDTNLLGEKIITYRTSGGGGSLGDCGGADYCAQRYLVNPLQILDEVLTFNREGLLMKMENVDKSNDPAAQQEVAAEGQAQKQNNQDAAAEQPQPHRKHHKGHAVPSAEAANTPLTDREHNDLQNLLYLNDLKEACHWRLSDAKEQKLAAVLANYRSRINSFDYDVDVSRATAQAQTNRIDACINSAVKPLVTKKIDFILSDN
jgi:hypothetical protein